MTGRVTAQLRRLWGLDNILSDGGGKTRADHRHHAIDALVVACTHPGITQRLSSYWQAEDAGVPPLRLDPPWPTIRADAAQAAAAIVVSHRVRKKVSGPLHKDTTFGDTGSDFRTASGVYRQFVMRKRVEELTKAVLEAEPAKTGEGIRDDRVRTIVQGWVAARGGDPKKAFPPYPRLGEDGPEIRRVRVLSKQQIKLMAKVATGYADSGTKNHHVAIYRLSDGETKVKVVSLLKAAGRLSRREPIVQRSIGEGFPLIMSLAPGEAVEFPSGDKAGIWIVQGFWANGQIVLERANDAAHQTTTRPNALSLLKAGARKVSIDPIGRVRPAND